MEYNRRFGYNHLNGAIDHGLIIMTDHGKRETMNPNPYGRKQRNKEEKYKIASHSLHSIGKVVEVERT